MVLVAVTKGGAAWKRFERVAEFFAVGVALLANACNLFVVSYHLIENPGSLEPVPLFYTSVGYLVRQRADLHIALLADRSWRPRRAF